jgi:hypothetical protein
MIAETLTLDQPTIDLLREQDALVQRSRALFAWLDWSQLDQQQASRHCPGPHPHPESAYLKAFLLKIIHHLTYMTHLRTFLCDHPLLVLELGFRPVPDSSQLYGFDVHRTVPSDRWLRAKLHRLDPTVLTSLLEQTVHALQAEIPGVGEVVAFDVKHMYAWVRENNPRESIRDRFCKERQPKGDPDCRVGVKKSTNVEQPDGSKKEVKEYLWGYGSGVAAATTPDYGDVVLAEYTQPFNEGDVSYYLPLHRQTVATLGFFPLHTTADAAYDAWYTYETVAHGTGIAAIPLNTHGQEEGPRDPDGTPLCSKGLRMHPTYLFRHSNGFRAQRFRCPLLFPERTGETCDHEQFAKAKGCVKDPNWEKGGLMRVLLDREGPLYHAVYTQRTCCERINSQAQALGIERPKVRNGHSVAHLNTLIYIVINVRALAKAKSINRGLLQIK